MHLAWAARCAGSLTRRIWNSLTARWWGTQWVIGGGATNAAGEPQSPYDALQPIMIGDKPVAVREGTAAMRAYQEMLYVL